MTACHIYYCTLVSCFIVVLPKSLAPVVKRCVDLQLVVPVVAR